MIDNFDGKRTKTNNSLRKFRGMRTDGLWFVYGSCFEVDDINGEVKCYIVVDNKPVEVDRKTVGISLDKEDSNGRLIYEDDWLEVIIKIDTEEDKYFGSIECNFNDFDYSLNDLDGNRIKLSDLYNIDEGEIFTNVVGNLHEGFFNGFKLD